MIEVTLADPAPAARAEVEELLLAADDEFFPSLSARSDTLSLTPQAPAQDAPRLARYLEEMSRESWLVARDDGALVGLLSFIPGYSAPALQGHSPSHYVTTIVVAPRARRRGIGVQLYGALQGRAVGDGVRYLTTRTWSGNDSHIALLRAHGFEVVTQVADDRGPGVDTLYFARPAEPPFVGLDRRPVGT